MTDFHIDDHGTIVIFSPQTDGAKEAAKSFSIELGPWHWLGPDTFAIDHRPAQGLIDSLEADGFTFAHAPVKS